MVVENALGATASYPVSVPLTSRRDVAAAPQEEPSQEAAPPREARATDSAPADIQPTYTTGGTEISAPGAVGYHFEPIPDLHITQAFVIDRRTRTILKEIPPQERIDHMRAFQNAFEAVTGDRLDVRR